MEDAKEAHHRSHRVCHGATAMRGSRGGRTVCRTTGTGTERLLGLLSIGRVPPWARKGLDGIWWDLDASGVDACWDALGAEVGAACGPCLATDPAIGVDAFLAPRASCHERICDEIALAVVCGHNCAVRRWRWVASYGSGGRINDESWDVECATLGSQSSPDLTWVLVVAVAGPTWGEEKASGSAL